MAHRPGGFFRLNKPNEHAPHPKRMRTLGAMLDVHKHEIVDIESRGDVDLYGAVHYSSALQPCIHKKWTNYVLQKGLSFPICSSRNFICFSDMPAFLRASLYLVSAALLAASLATCSNTSGREATRCSMDLNSSLYAACLLWS